MVTLKSPTARRNDLAPEIEALFDTHNVTAEKLQDKYGDESESAEWGVVCDDCGQAKSFFLTPNDGELDVSDVYLESFENEPCEPYAVPDVDTGDHDIVIHDQDPGEIGGERACHCTNCGRTTTVPANAEYASTDLEKFGDLPCGDTYTDTELGGAVLYPSLSTYPDKHEVGIGNWIHSGSHGWGKDIGSFWYHQHFPVRIVLSRKFGARAVKMNVVKGGMPRNPGSIRNETLTVVEYQSSKQDDVDYDVPKRVLRFMQATNDYDGDDEDFEDIRNAINTDIISYFADNHDLERTVPKHDA